MYVMLTASTLHHPHHVAEHVVQGQRWLLFTAESYAQHIATVVLCLCSDVIRCGGEDDYVLKISCFPRNVAHGHKYRVLKHPDGRKKYIYISCVEIPRSKGNYSTGCCILSSINRCTCPWERRGDHDSIKLVPPSRKLQLCS